MKESLSFAGKSHMPEGWRVPRLWMYRISCRLRLSLLPEMGQRAQMSGNRFGVIVVYD